MRRFAIFVLALSVALPLSAFATKKKKKPAAKTTATASKKKKRRGAPKPPPATAEQRVDAKEFVADHSGESLSLGIENPAALIPFFERIYQTKELGKPGAVHVLHYGDSHTASDDWPGAIRTLMQAKFGDGGAGFVHAGHPFEGYRRFDAKGTQSRGWTPHGLLNREGDGRYGLAGVQITATRAGETLTLDASGTELELFYEKQPGGGALTIEENGTTLATIDTAGTREPAYWHQTLAQGLHRVTLRTETHGAVTVYGWTLGNATGLSWETLGINGAQADLLTLWNADVLKSNIAHRDPALIVLAYGTNEARRPSLTHEGYREILIQVVKRLREAAPAASILIVGAPDQSMRVRSRATPVDNVDSIIAAQREAALATGCAFWNLRLAMGGKGSMKQWVVAGMGQGDFVHLTAPGYRLWGEAVAQLLIDNYSVYRSVRQQVFGNTNNGSPQQNH